MDIYNSKEFLLPDSINSCALYHAKIFPDGRYMFRIHDCNTGIRLVGDLNNPAGAAEAISKLTKLSQAAAAFAGFIQENYQDKTKMMKHELSLSENTETQGEYPVQVTQERCPV